VTAPPVAAVVAVPPVGAIGFAPEPPATVPPAAPKTSGPAVVAGAESGRRGGLKPAVALKAHATQADKPSVASAGDRAGIAPPVAGVAAAPLASGDGFAPELPAAPVPKASGPAAGAGAESGRREESKRAVVLKTGVALVLLLAGLVLMLQLPRGPIWRPSEFNDKGLAAYQQNDEGLAAYQQNDKGLVAYQQNDYAEAMIWYRMAADRNFAAAQNNVGLLYERGHGVPQDYTEAMRWYRMAADQNFAAAQCNIGLLYLNGQGVPHDFAQARSWMKKAAANGDDFAKQWLATH
jgi:tetratricopeptide (TPR) repeat protein